MYVMHHAFRRDLDRLVGAVRKTPLGDRDVWRALHERWSFVDETLHHHHAVEDSSIWPTLLEHARTTGHEADLQTLEDMEAEHATIDPGLAGVRTAFAQVLADGDEDHRNALDIRLTALREGLLAHMQHEETEALPMIQRTMSDEEFAATEEAAQRAYPLRMVPTLVPWVLDELPEEGRERMFAMAGPAYRLLSRLFVPRYERRTRAAFKYA